MRLGWPKVRAVLGPVAFNKKGSLSQRRHSNRRREMDDLAHLSTTTKKMQVTTRTARSLSGTKHFQLGRTSLRTQTIIRSSAQFHIYPTIQIGRASPFLRPNEKQNSLAAGKTNRTEALRNVVDYYVIKTNKQFPRPFLADHIFERTTL
jgi:hypothetical protein